MNKLSEEARGAKSGSAGVGGMLKVWRVGSWCVIAGDESGSYYCTGKIIRECSSLEGKANLPTVAKYHRRPFQKAPSLGRAECVVRATGYRVAFHLEVAVAQSQLRGSFYVKSQLLQMFWP